MPLKPTSRYYPTSKGTKKYQFYLPIDLYQAFQAQVSLLDPSPITPNRPRYGAIGHWLAVAIEEWLEVQKDKPSEFSNLP